MNAKWSKTCLHNSKQLNSACHYGIYGMSKADKTVDQAMYLY